MHIAFTPTRLVADAGDGLLDADLQAINPQDKPAGKAHTALGGNTEGVLYRIEEQLAVTTTPARLTTAQVKKWRAFAASVAAAESFTFDPYGTAASPDDPQAVRLQMGSFREQRQPGGVYVFQFTTVRVIA